MKSLLLCALVALSACSPARDQVELSGMAMGTQFNVKLPNGAGNRDALLLQKRIEDTLESVEQMMSTYRIESEISRFNASTTNDWVVVSSAFCVSVEEALDLGALTGGAFDITIGPLVNLWGFGPGDYIDAPPAPERIAAAQARVGYQHLETDCRRPAIRKAIPDLELDMSAFGKGYAVDRVAELLDSMGFANYLVEVGGELRLRGANVEGRRWAVGIEVPLPGRRQPHTVLRVTDTAVATSGDYRNFFEHGGKLYSHTIDTRTGMPVTHSLASVTVIDPNCARADALATALLVLGPDDGTALAMREDLAVLFLLRDGDAIEQRASPAYKSQVQTR